MDKSDCSGIWAYLQSSDGKISRVGWEVLGAARQIADQRGAVVTAVVLGSGITGAGDEIIHHGADRVLLYDNPALSSFNDEIFAGILARAVEQEKPEAVFGAATFYGKSLFPRLAARFETGLAPDVTAVELDGDGNIVATRPAYGGNVILQVSCPESRPQFVTIRPKAFNESAADTSRTGEKLTPAIDSLPESGTEVTESIEEGAGKISLTEADIIVSGGRGIKGPENYRLIEELAEVLDAAAGASRAVVDAGWVPYSHQVGQTGKTVNPKLYIACGISGAIQHLAGMQSSKYIVAINKDPDAPIFKIATFGVVGDLFEIVPPLTAKLKEVLGK